MKSIHVVKTLSFIAGVVRSGSRRLAERGQMTEKQLRSSLKNEAHSSVSYNCLMVPGELRQPGFHRQSLSTSSARE